MEKTTWQFGKSEKSEVSKTQLEITTTEEARCLYRDRRILWIGTSPLIKKEREVLFKSYRLVVRKG